MALMSTVNAASIALRIMSRLREVNGEIQGIDTEKWTIFEGTTPTTKATPKHSRLVAAGRRRTKPSTRRAMAGRCKIARTT